MVFGYDLLCDLLEMLNLINIGSAVATRRNLCSHVVFAIIVVKPMRIDTSRAVMEHILAAQTCTSLTLIASLNNQNLLRGPVFVRAN
jgi:hypothetical protein